MMVELTLQEWFDVACRASLWLRGLGMKSATNFGAYSCRYCLVLPEGEIHCFIGAALSIPLGLEMEDESASDLLRLGVIGVKGLEPEAAKISLMHLQKIHDVFPMEEWSRELRAYAEDYKLSVNVDVG